jgi:hypothetical protein
MKIKPEVTTKNRVQKKSSRFYDIEGDLLPSVTTILTVIAKPALMNWAAKVEREMVLKVACDLHADCADMKPPMTGAAWLLTMNARLGKEKASAKELAKAGDIGTQCHELIEWTLRGELMQEVGPSPKISDAAQWAFMSWQDWRRAVNLKVVAVEQVVYSQKYGYAGTLDLVAYVSDILTVLDWKTGKAVYSEAHLQNAALRQALREMGHGDPKQGLIVRLPKVETDPYFEVVPAKPEELMFPKFLDAKSVWTWAQEMEAEYQAKQKPPEQNIEKTLTESLAQQEGAGA